MVFGAIGGALHALATVIFGVDHIVSGVAINIMAVGVAAFLADTWFSGLQGGGPTQSPPVDGPSAAQRARGLRLGQDDRGQALVLRLRPGVGARRADPRPVVADRAVAAARARDVLHPVAHARSGCGCAPAARARSAAETLGVNVYRYKFVAVLVSGAIAGLAGGFIVLVGAGLYQNGITNGRGYIGLAAMIFGNWRPGGLHASGRRCSATPTPCSCAPAAARCTRC